MRQVPASSVGRVRSILTPVRTPSVLVAVFVALVMAGSVATTRVSAQARELASPWGGAAPAAPADELEVAEVPTPAGGDAVPPPPGSYGDDGVGDVRVVEPGDVPTQAIQGASATGWVPAEVGSSLQIRSSISTRLRSLDADLQVLALRGGGNIVDGVLAIVMGSVSIGIGVFIDVDGGTTTPNMTPYLYLYGGASIVRGVLDFVFMRNPSTSAITYTHMPMGDLAEVRARLQYGESELESLAQTAEISRILDGALSIGVGLAVVPVYLGPNNFTFSSAFDYFVLIGAAVSATTGIITLFSLNEAERRWTAYRELRERLLATEQGAADELELERAAEQLQAFERAPAGAEVRPVLSGMQGGFFAGASGTF